MSTTSTHAADAEQTVNFRFQEAALICRAVDPRTAVFQLYIGIVLISWSFSSTEERVVVQSRAD